MLVNSYLMRKQTFFIAFWLLLTFISCKKEVQITFIESDFDTDNNIIVHINVPVANSNENISKKINSTIETHISSMLQVGNPERSDLKSIKKSVAYFKKEFNNFKDSFPENIQEWEAQIDGEVVFQSTQIITVALTSYINTGGAHGALNVSLLNFNAETGNKIENNSLFDDIEGFKEVAKTYFKEETLDKDLLDISTEFILPNNIGYNNEGVILIYNTYEVAPYSTGIIEFMIPFEKVKSYLVF